MRDAVVHEQMPLFGGSRSSQPPRPAPLAASADPISSHLAAAEVTASGRRDSQKREILEALRAESAPVTSMELARAAGIDRYTVARRLPDLERDRLVERGQLRDCRVSGRPCVTWRIKESL
jgi:response regulator of citrate/malate metabolism